MKPRDPKPQPQPTPAVPPVVWPTDEGRNTFVLTNQTAWHRHTEAARGRREQAERLGAEIGVKAQALEELRQKIDALVQEKQKQDRYAGQEQGAADAYAVALAALGEQLPPPPDRLVAGMPGMSPLEAAAHAAAWKDMAPTGFHQTLSGSPQGDPQEHAAAFGGAFSPHAERPADGYCINCGEPAWREPVHPENAPKGAKHGFGASCTNDPNQVADLGDNPGPLR